MKRRRQTGHKEIVVFALDEPRYALPLTTVERVVRAVDITPLPKAPEIVLGVINAEGRIVPVVDIRRRFGLPARELQLEDRFLIARTSRRVVALVVDSVAGIQELDGRQSLESGQALAFAPYLQGVAKLADGLVLIYDLDQFLSLDEERKLDAALSGGPG
ncbi:MAG: purine-binding chemotaxis protein CheW [Desulfarculus sp.]|jgi:purine-binding chemotaxis protein CheW|nr:MAG: purine-binding chemotaxis protein CheW [Desulfarculus sp.]